MSTFLGTMVLFPAMLLLLERWKARKGGAGMVRRLGVGEAEGRASDQEERKSA